MNLYKKKCGTCKIETPHVIYMASKMKGVKISCVRCNTKKPRYFNLSKLEVSE